MYDFYTVADFPSFDRPIMFPAVISTFLWKVGDGLCATPAIAHEEGLPATYLPLSRPPPSLPGSLVKSSEHGSKGHADLERAGGLTRICCTASRLVGAANSFLFWEGGQVLGASSVLEDGGVLVNPFNYLCAE